MMLICGWPTVTQSKVTAAAGIATTDIITATHACQLRMMFRAWFPTIIATLDGFNGMDSVEVFRWQRDGFEECG
jgi:hypothetical protein